MTQSWSRRNFIKSSLAVGALACVHEACARADEQPSPLATTPPRILKSLKWGMIGVEGGLVDRFQAAKDAGFVGVELDSPGGPPAEEVRAATLATGLVVDGVVDSTHWSPNARLSSPDPQHREQGLDDLLRALADAGAWGGNSVLLVPGHGQDGSKDEVWQRSAQQIQKALPTAARLGIHILIENVWNQMFYQHDGPANQTADELAAYVDQFNSPWVGVQFDIGNHQKYGSPANWIRTLGKRIVKLDVKDWGVDAGFCKIGDGDVDWEEVRAALKEIGYTGWAAAEVAGGNAERLSDISNRMTETLGI